MGKRTPSPSSRSRAKKPNTGSPGTCVTCGGVGTVLAPKGAPASQPSLCADCGGTGKLAAGKVTFVPGQLQTPEPLTDSRTVFRALLARDFRVKGSVVVFPGGLSATLEVVVKSVAEAAASLENRTVSLERLVEVVAANLYAEAQDCRGRAGKNIGPTFVAWWDVVKSSVGY